MQRESRKLEHVQLALQQEGPGRNHFDDLILLHNPIPGLRVEDISLKSQIGELGTSSPLLINGMTGGAEETKAINRSLAIAAREWGLPMAVGSQKAAIRNPQLKDTYRVVRQVNPAGINFANLGSYATVDEAYQAVEMIAADGLQIHLNVMQELIMPEGDRDFTGTLERIGTIVSELKLPVIVKEVGFGMPREAIARLKEIGVRMIDVSGKGGTNFAAIENQRAGGRYPFLDDWGIPTPISLLEASQVPGIEVIASGGLRHGLDVVKSLALGASLAGMAGRFLKVAVQEGANGLIRYIGELHQQIRLIMTAIGVRSIAELRNHPVIIRGETLEWCRVRGIPAEAFAQRGFAGT